MEKTIISYDPSNGERLGQVRATAIEQIPGVVKKAKTAAESWKILGLDERLKIIQQAYAQAEPRINELAELLSREMGKDIRRSTGEVNGTVFGGPYIAEEAREAFQPKQAGNGTIIEYRPLGVAAVISPWNYPLAMANNLIVPALVAGNTVVFKPSEETPLIADTFVKILNQKLPEGVLQIIFGNGDQGKALVESQVNLIAFTGSQAVGKDIMARAAGGLKRLIMELGGNDPMIVLEDADISAAARFAVASSFENAGQMCTSTERIYVDKKIADTFEKQVVEVASRYKTRPLEYAWGEHWPHHQPRPTRHDNRSYQGCRVQRCKNPSRRLSATRTVYPANSHCGSHPGNDHGTGRNLWSYCGNEPIHQP